MQYQTLQITELSPCITVTLHRPQQRNSINSTLLTELHQVLDFAESHAQYRFIILQGANGIFCTGMDFQELLDNSAYGDFAKSYMALLKRFTQTSKIIISLLDGQVLAGGVGFAAASDLIISTSRTQLSLSEALWGLLPACVMPFLIRRVGFQKAYAMTLTMDTLNAETAYKTGLIDELTENLEDSLRRLLLRLNRINQQTVTDLKAYFKKMWIITDEMETVAVNELTRLTAKPEIRNNIKNFIEHQQFPWEKTESIS
jgi:polyketide biosynthesis enoyl-CoA hydratase PksH